MISLRSLGIATAAVGVLIVAACCMARPEPQVLVDSIGDATVRRTDVGDDGAINPLTTLPDLVSVTIGPWCLGGLYAGAGPADSPGGSDRSMAVEGGTGPDGFELILVFQGLACPPGPLGLAALPFDPYRYGASPVYGFIEFDVDEDKDTGGEFGGPENPRYLANVGRFGEVPYGALHNRAAFDGTDLDVDFASTPQIERSGADFSLVLCGCFDIGVTETFGDNDGTFDPGDRWIVAGRFFQRAGGYEEASAAFGGSFFGLYDPIVELEFSHDIQSDRTTLTLLFPLTMAGAATLAGEPEEPIDLDVSNQVSVEEALQDIIDGAMIGGLTDPTYTLTHLWAQETAAQHLDPSDWRITGIVGSSYSAPDAQGALYVWTDAAGNHQRADFNGDGSVNGLDADAVEDVIDERDGGPMDADGAVNNEVVLWDFAANFSVFDLDADGIIDDEDHDLVHAPLPGDANHDCLVNFADILCALANWGQQYPPQGAPGLGDADQNGAVEFKDIVQTLAMWGAECS